MVRRNKPSADEFAAMWAQLPPARQQELVGEVQAALREVMNTGAVQPLHPPFRGTHSHSHSAYRTDGSTGQHAHSHDHEDDADHGHDHPEILEAIESAERAKRSRREQSGRQQARVMNSASARKPGDDPWERLAAMSQPTD